MIVAAESASTQGYSPFEGRHMEGRVRHVFLRGAQILSDGEVVGEPSGRYVSRPG